MSSNKKKCNDPHYWIIVDKPCKNWKEYITNDEWLVLCDRKYQEFTKYKGFHVRAFFNDISSKPCIVNEKSMTKGCSENFKEFIGKLMEQYDNYGMHISSLKSKDREFLNLYKRQKKLERVLDEH